MKRRNVLHTIGAGALALLGLGADTVTTPVPHGYRDWDRSRGIADLQVLNEVGINIAGSQDFGPFFVGDVPYLFVECLPVQRARITLSWFVDEAMTMSLNDDVLVTPVGGAVTQCVPVRGAFLFITVEVSVNPSIANIRIFKTSSPFAASGGLQGGITLIGLDNVNLVALATTSISAVVTRGGWIHWRASTFASTNMHARLYAVSFTGATTLLDHSYSQAMGGGGMCFAPAQPLRVDLTNNDAVDHTCSINVTHHPFYP